MFCSLTWKSSDRVQPHGSDENGPTALEEALLGLGVQARHLVKALSAPQEQSPQRNVTAIKWMHTCLQTIGGIHMSQLGTFFKGDDTRLGVFYPQHSLLAIFPDIEQAWSAQKQLRAAGFSDDEVTVASGADLIELDEEESAKNGLSGYLMKEFSRFLATEAVYTDSDLKQAKRGAAVLVVHCPDERTKKSAWRILAPAGPLVARYYAGGCIEHLAGES
jgi:hypothetical protein